MNTSEIVTLVAAILGASGVGAFFREIVSGIGKISGGISSRESRRRIDIAQERDDAIRMEEHWKARADMADRNRRKSDEYAAQLRIALIDMGVSRKDLPCRPSYEDQTGRPELG